MCEKCGVKMDPESRLIAAIFGDKQCRDCSKQGYEAEFPTIVVDGLPLAKYLAKQKTIELNELI